MPDSEKPKALDVLRGQKPADKPPAQMYRQSVHLTPNGTETQLGPTPEGRAYLAKLAREAAAEERQKAKVIAAPRLPRRMLAVETEFGRKQATTRDIFNQSAKQKDRGNDVER